MIAAKSDSERWIGGKISCTRTHTLIVRFRSMAQPCHVVRENKLQDAKLFAMRMNSFNAVYDEHHSSRPSRKKIHSTDQYVCEQGGRR